MMRSLFLIAVFVLSCFSAKATAFDQADPSDIEVELKSEESLEASHFLFIEADSSEQSGNASTESATKPKKRKLKAALLSVLLGHFGVHRIYLGTSANVPVAYSLTLGGGLGLLPLIDTIAIISSKNLDEFSNNDRVIMWSKPKGE
jgi:TM2 domain-containing membrane protein YozV